MSTEIISGFGMELWQVYLIIIVVGCLQGIINTIAGAGTAVMYSTLSIFGMPVNMINGTVRLGILFQTGASSIKFYKKNKLSVRKGLILGFPMILGSVAGAMFAVSINKELFEIIVGVILLLMLILIFYDPQKWLEGQSEQKQKKTGWIQIMLFLGIGFYGGFIHIGVGIFLLSALVLNAGFDLVHANALKVFLVMMYAPVVLLIFLLNGQVDLWVALFAAIGNTTGGLIGTNLAIKKGAKFIRIFLVVVIISFSLHLFGVWEFFAKLFL